VATLRMSGVGADAVRPVRGGSVTHPAGSQTRPYALVAACLWAAVLLTLRWHAVLVVGPCLLLLFSIRRSRRAGLALLAVTILAAGFSYGALYARTGSLQSAAPLQVATGAVYRQYGPGREQEAVAEVFSNYAAWMQTAPPVTPAMLLDAERANLPRFLTRKAVLAGIGLLLLLALVYRRWPPGALPLLLFIPGYCAAVATTYFTPRASALPELCGLVLAAAALHLPFTQREHELRQQMLEKRRLHFKPNGPSLALDYAALGTVIALSALLVIGYNCYRVQRDLRSVWQAQFRERNAVYDAALQAADGEPTAIWGRFDLIPPRAHLPWCLPGPSYTRLWMDDPRVAPNVDPYLHVSDVTQVSPLYLPEIKVVLLWPKLDAVRASEIRTALSQNKAWLPAVGHNTPAEIWTNGWTTGQFILNTQAP
jgi:hypothetical protein